MVFILFQIYSAVTEVKCVSVNLKMQLYQCLVRYLLCDFNLIFQDMRICIFICCYAFFLCVLICVHGSRG